jgi:hypothetical protein
MLTVISLGAGVQSTTLALMAKQGLIRPMPDCAIFADTGEEPKAVYAHLAWLMNEADLPFPIHISRAWEGMGKGDITAPLGDELLDSVNLGTRAGSRARPPLFTLNEDGSKGMVHRQCTGDYKIDVIVRTMRGMLGLERGQRWPKGVQIEQWIGISTDEATRMKPSLIPAIRSRWPLIEAEMSRKACLAWLRSYDYPQPPKSACTFCPFHSDAEWRNIRDTDPEGWERAVQIDEAIRHGLTPKRLTGALFVHSKRVPLKDVDLSTAEDRGQLNLFENECAGVCGV